MKSSSSAMYSRCGFSKTRQWAYDLIAWYEVCEIVGTKAKPQLLTVAAARPLKSVRKDKALVRQIMAEAKKLARGEGTDLKARHVAEAKRKIMGTEPPKKAKVKPVEVATAIVKDLVAVSDSLRKATTEEGSLDLTSEEKDDLKAKVAEMERIVAVIKEQLRPFGSSGVSEG